MSRRLQWVQITKMQVRRLTFSECKCTIYCTNFRMSSNSYSKITACSRTIRLTRVVLAERQRIRTPTAYDCIFKKMSDSSDWIITTDVRTLTVFKLVRRPFEKSKLYIYNSEISKIYMFFNIKCEIKSIKSIIFIFDNLKHPFLFDKKQQLFGL